MTDRVWAGKGPTHPSGLLFEAFLVATCNFLSIYGIWGKRTKVAVADGQGLLSAVLHVDFNGRFSATSIRGSSLS